MSGWDDDDRPVHDWRDRFRAPSVSFPQWSHQQPDRLFFVGDDGGSPQAWVLDRSTGVRHQLTHQRVGVEALVPLPDGSGAAWWCDDTGDESGAWFVAPADGGPSSPLVTGVPDGWSTGIALAPDTAALGIATTDSYRVVVVRGKGEPVTVWESAEPAGLGRPWETLPGGLSTDGALVAAWHCEGGDLLHVGIRVIDASGTAVGDLRDEGLTLACGPWSPVPGDQRLALVHERDGIERPAVWSPLVDERRDYPLDLPGPVDVAGWYPGADALLLVHQHHGRAGLYRLDLASGAVDPVHDPHGWISGAGVRPDGEVWLREESSTRPARVRTAGGTEVLAALGAPPRPGAERTSMLVEGEGGPIHVLLSVPAGPPPYPTVVVVHGGPEWAFPDDLDPWEQALVASGYAVAKPNYRGSTGSTVAWRTVLHAGNIGVPEVSDVVATVDHLVRTGVADAGRTAVEGWSWGGYVALLAAGLHPSRWAAVVAGIPVCHSVLTHEDCSPVQQAYDRAIMGGSPREVPERYDERSPHTYLGEVDSPVLLVAGEHDSACPIRQVRWYADALAARGGDVTLHVYDAGHHATAVDDRVHHAELVLAFLERHVPVEPR